MHSRIILFIAAAICSLATVRAQDTNVVPIYTKLEMFDAQIGRVIVKGSVDLGTVSARTAVISVKAKESTDVSTALKEYGVVVGVKEENFPEIPTVIDYDELDGLIEAIEYIGKVDISVTSLPSFQAIYRTRADLRLLGYSSKREPGVVHTALQTLQHVGGSRVVIAPDQLAGLRNLLVEAKATLDSLRKRGS